MENTYLQLYKRKYSTRGYGLEITDILRTSIAMDTFLFRNHHISLHRIMLMNFIDDAENGKHSRSYFCHRIGEKLVSKEY